MLVIRCREGESVAIGDNIAITVLSAGPGKVKLGFTAPAFVVVARRCAELTRRQNCAAVHGTDSSVIHGLKAYLTGTQSQCNPHVLSVPSDSPSLLSVGRRQENRTFPLHLEDTADK